MFKKILIPTDGSPVAAKAVSAQQDKTSAVETLHRAEQARDKTVGVDR